ncbi:hypothetical protein, variant 1 [Aphanomyces astaci]|uniref:Uncharacterized protein n=1 Tax=Aphanomyces astaci TaxID=112090 RepID=W4HC76_APHAT|nr:hypothetical protein, variant 1 [Aphanomyces astaci]ETV89580.1 hypothetical protein, variant 1 [Aphanomyces astaci]|eukprot:XP_009821980.1 hypothetical protein, variant 1 [Aphanomyces astaci]
MVAFTSPSSSVGMQWPAKFGFPPILDLASANLNYTQGTRNVFKFGGTSVGSPERLFQLVTIVKAERKRVMSVVVSAMGKNTDLLLDAASAAASGDIDAALALIDRVEELTIRNANDTQRLILGDDKPIEDLTKDIQAFHVPLRQLLLGVSLLREQTLAALDTVLSFGERISATIVAKLLTANGVPAIYVDARKWVVTNESFGCAKVDFEASKAKLVALAPTWGSLLPVITGFIGKSTSGRTTTLGRNGSDYTATLIGASLQADYVVINTDISGVMTADPRIVGSATSVSHLSHHEALELAIYGTRMFHTRTMVPLINSGVTMLIRNTMDPSGNGTYISSLASADKSVTCTTSLENLSLIEVRTRILQEADRHEHGNVGARVIQCLEHERVHIWLSIRAAHGQSISIVVPSHQEVVARTAIATELKSELQNNEVDTVNCVSPVTMLSIVGEKLNKASANAAKMFTALATAGIDVLAVGQGTSSRSLSCIVHGAKTKLAVRRVHDAFNASTLVANLILLGCNGTTRSILDKIIGQADKYRQRHNVELRVVGFGSNCTPFQFDPNGIKLDTLVDQLQSCSKATPLRRDCGLYDHARPSDDIVSLIHDLSCPILVDCSGRSDNAAFYSSCFAKDIHVIVSNVRSANSVPKSSASPSLHALDPCYFLYNSVVGASLPIFDTLANLLNTGDHLHRVDAALSGTLGYVCDRVMRDGVTLSQAIRDAWDHGYMEANPKEDLSGDDVAHKVKVFARALGTSLALSDIEVTPFVPTSILDDLHWDNDVVDVEKLVQALEAYDATFDATFVQPALQQRKRLRYVATLVMGTASLSARIELLLVDESHPSFRTQDNDIAVGLTTTEYNVRLRP